MNAKPMLTRKAYVVTTTYRRLSVHATSAENVPKAVADQLQVGERVVYFTDGHTSFDATGKRKVW